MTYVGITEAKARFPDLVAMVEAGDEVVITRWGKSIARLKPMPATDVDIAQAESDLPLPEA